MKTWNTLTANWDEDDEENDYQGMMVVNPHDQVAEHEETEYETE